MPYRKGKKNRKGNILTTSARISPVENSTKIYQFSGDQDGTTVWTIGVDDFLGRDWKLTSLELTMCSASPNRVEITTFGSGEQISTKDLTVGTVPTVLKFRTPKRADYTFTPADETESLSIFITSSSAPITLTAIALVTFKPLRNDTSSSRSVNVVRGICL
jgi:hypothetical protein